MRLDFKWVGNDLYVRCTKAMFWWIPRGFAMQSSAHDLFRPVQTESIVDEVIAAASRIALAFHPGVARTG